MKKIMISIAVVACAMIVYAKGSGSPIPDTDLVYTGPGGVESFTDAVADRLTNYPWSDVPIPPGTVLIKITNPGSKSCKIQPAGKGSQDTIALIIEGGPRKIQMDFGQAKGAGNIPYMYINGKAGKALFKGVADDIGRVVVDNDGDSRGIHLQNISKAKGSGGGFKDIIIAGRLKRAQSNHAGFGGPDDKEAGVIMIGNESDKGQIKTHPKGAVANILICKTVDTNVFATFQEAYDTCVASNAVQPGVEMTAVKKINTKALGPAVLAVDVEKKYKAKQVGKRIKITDPVVGLANVTE